MRIRNQVHAHPGQLRGPAPTPHQVRQLDLRVEALPGGKLRLTTPAARGWAAVVRGPTELNRAVTEAFTEAQCAAYARWRGERYDLDALTDPVAGDPLAPPRQPPRRAVSAAATGWGRNQMRRPDTADPNAWQKLPDGSWQSPGGRRYRPDSKMVLRVVARRQKFGLPI